MRRILFAPLLAVALATACGEPTEPGSSGTDISLSVTGLRSLDPATEGSYQVWLVGPSGLRTQLGLLLGASGTYSLLEPVPASAIEITVERPGDTDNTPSAQLLLRGAFAGGRADLVVDDALTQGNLPLRREPGQFTMFSPSDNLMHGYPSFEESGIWLFNMAPRDTPQNDMWVRLTQLRTGWTYEGWMVRDYGSAQAIWLSYGKFLPDQSGAVNARDDTGWGPFSGVLDFKTAGEEEFPGDDWISNPLGYPFPATLTLPLNLREQNGDGSFRWTHVITIEPAWNRGEPIGSERPFLVVPYRDAFGGGGPGEPRAITFRPDGVPGGTATIR